jgi:hypothetical protein
MAISLMKNNNHINIARITTIILAFFILQNLHQAYSQGSNPGTPDYKEIFGDDYNNALNIIEKNYWWSDTLTKDGLDADFALAVIFPELIRYSSIADYIEVKGLEVLYVQYGRDYADFSVGLFQMKPSFAEKIESDIFKYELLNKFPHLSALRPDLSETPVCRRNRIIRLQDEYCQLLYLEAFIRIMDILYPDSTFHSLEGQLIFYATAYNTGYFKDEEVIRHEISEKRFYQGMDAISIKYIYSDIALSYYLSKKVKR